MRRTIGSVILVLAVASVARADTTRVSVPAVRGPLDVAMTLDAHTEHGCSQSHESIGENLVVALRVDHRGAAELDVDRTVNEVFGPSFGSYQQGARDFTYIQQREVHRYRGRATVRGPELELTFDRDRRGETRVSGRGRAPDPTLTDGPTTLRLRCRVAPVDVYPSGVASVPTNGETPQSVALLRCELPDGVPDAFGRLEEAGGALALGRHGGVTQRFARMFGRADSIYRMP